jgi:hypothetical protein
MVSRFWNVMLFDMDLLPTHSVVTKKKNFKCLIFTVHAVLNNLRAQIDIGHQQILLIFCAACKKVMNVMDSYVKGIISTLSSRNYK